MFPGDLSDDDRQVHRRWSIAFGIVYGTIALMFMGLVAFHPPITTEVAMKVESAKPAEATGSIPSAPRIPANK